MPVRPVFAAAIEHTESGGNPNAVSPKGAIGLNQIMPGTARSLGYTPEQMYDPTLNREARDKYLGQLSDKYNGNEYLMAAAYNAGPGRVDKWLAGQGRLPAETQAYVPKVMGFMNGDGGQMLSTDSANSAFLASRQRRSDEALGQALGHLQPQAEQPEEEQAQAEQPQGEQPSLGQKLMNLVSPAEASAAEGPPAQPEVQTGSLQPAAPMGIPPMTFTAGKVAEGEGGKDLQSSVRGGPVSPGAPQVEAGGLQGATEIRAGGFMNDLIAYARSVGLQGVGEPGAPPSADDLKEGNAFAMRMALAAGGMEGGGGGPVELPPEAEVEPPVTEGMTRLYRGEAQHPAPIEESGLPMAPEEGRWFSTDKEKAQGHLEAIQRDRPQAAAQMNYVDVPTDKLDQYSKGRNEYVLPSEAAATQQPLRAQGAAAALAAPAAEVSPGQPPPKAPPPSQFPGVLGAGEVPHRVLTMQEAAKATPMDEATFNSIQTIGDGEHTLIKDPIDPLDLLRMHYYGIAKGREAFNAGEVARQTGNAGDMVHSALLNNELENVVTPRWAAAWHQFGLGLRLGRELKPESDFMRDMAQIMSEDNDIGGLLHAMSKVQTPEERAEIMRQSLAGRLQNLGSNLLDYYVESLLSVNTLFKKGLTDATLAMWQVPERWTAEQLSRVGRMLGAAPENTIAPGEAQALAHGLIAGAEGASQLAMRALKEDRSPLDPDVWGPMGWGDASRSNAPRLAEGTPLEGSPLGLGLDMMAEFVHLPSRGILTTDTYAKAINAHANLDALMYRRAYWQTAAKGLGDEEFAEAVEAAHNKLRAKPPTDLMQQSIAAARKNTLAQPLDLHPGGAGWFYGEGTNKFTFGRTAQAIQNARTEAPLLRTIAPFWPTLVNLSRTSVEFGGPLGILSRSMRDDIMSGGPQMYTAMARMGMSSVLMTGLWKYVQGAGPKNPLVKKQWEEDGNQEYSIGTAHHDIGNLPEPLAETVRLVADIKDLSGRVHQKDADSLGTAAIVLLSKQLDDSSSIQNLMNVITLATSGKDEFERERAEGNMMSQMTPEQQELQESVDEMSGGSPSQKAHKALLKLGGTVVPTSIANLAHAIDPVRRQVRDMHDEILSRTPGWSRTLEPEVNLWGKPAIQPLGWNRAIGNQVSLFRATEIKNDPVTKMLDKLNINVPMLGNDGTLTIGGGHGMVKMPVSTEQVTRVNTLRGTMKNPYNGLDLHAALQAQMDRFPHIPDPNDRRTAVMRTIGNYSHNAVRKLYNEDEDVKTRYETVQQARKKFHADGAASLGAPP